MPRFPKPKRPGVSGGGVPRVPIAPGGKTKQGVARGMASKFGKKLTTGGPDGFGAAKKRAKKGIR